ncbi:hypothetical protein [Streptomyces sp. NPDC093260]|uniref:hypothetical protein n=1 Tax=Streptomyces sp. NPDC093260 TaxID=3155073 RepID=UPI0034469D48
MIKRAGFYREIGGRATTADVAPSLRGAVQDVGPWDEDRVLAYLESGLEIYSTMGAERDVLTGEEWIAGSGSLMTDGTWLWPVDLTHYVRRHHAALPQEFLDHIRANDYTVPAVPDEQARRVFWEEFPDNAPAAAPPKAVGFCTWYAPKPDGARAHQLLAHLENAGLFAVHPLTNALFGFRETPAGHREPLMGEGAALAAALADDRYSTIEFTCWKGYDQSLTGIVRRTDETTQSITLRLPGRTRPWCAGCRALSSRIVGLPPTRTNPPASRSERNGTWKCLPTRGILLDVNEAAGRRAEVPSPGGDRSTAFPRRGPAGSAAARALVRAADTQPLHCGRPRPQAPADLSVAGQTC